MARSTKPLRHQERQAEVRGLSEALDVVCEAMRNRSGVIRDRYQSQKARRLNHVADTITQALQEALSE
jgi:hypothetical protein